MANNDSMQVSALVKTCVFLVVVDTKSIPVFIFYFILFFNIADIILF